MRLTDDQIRQGLLHAEQPVRDVAVGYFADSFSDDPSVMPLAVEAIEEYGWKDAFGFPRRLARLVQTEGTLLWLIDAVNRVGHPRASEDANLCLRASAIIAQADVALLMKYEEKILGLEGLTGKARDAVAERLGLTALDTESCWEELEGFCEANKAVRSMEKVDLPHAERLAEAVARDESSGDRVLALLSRKVESVANSPMAWMEPLAIRIAGLMGLDEAAPSMAAILRADRGEYANDQCAHAVIRLGTDAAVDALCKDFPGAPRAYRLYAAGALAGMHTAAAIARCREFLEHEKELRVRRNLTLGVLGSFCSEGIEPARQSILQGSGDLRRELVGVATLMDVPFAELESWKATVRREDEAAARRAEEFQPAPASPKGKAASHGGLSVPPSTIAKKPHVGRNDPCPCGSGKKFKKCCGKAGRP